MVQEIKLNQIDAVVTTVGTPWTDDNIPTEKAVRDAIIAAGIWGWWWGSDLLDIVTFTRVASAANWTVTYAHSAWVIPEYIMLQSSADTWDDRNTWSDWRWNLSVNGCTYWSFNDGGADTSTTHSVVLRTQVWPEEKASWVITAITSTTFDITWTLTGTPTGTTFNIVAYVYWPTWASASSKRWWDGADGAIDGTTNVTIAGSNNTYIVKNYTSWAAGGAARVLTITPTNCLLHIKIQGNCDLTNWTFNFAGKWAAGGAAVTGFSDPWLDWVSWANLITWFVNWFGWAGNVAWSSTWFGGWGWAGKATDGAVWVGWWGGTAWVSALGWALSTVIAGRRFVSYIGAGWGSGGTNVNAWWGAPTSGAGGAGWGAVILEIAGNLTLDNGSTVITMNWAAGGNATTPWATGAGGGGWGGGWTFLCLYNGTLTGTVTPTVAWGAAWLKANWGTNTDWWAGGNGEFLIDKNTVFA